MKFQIDTIAKEIHVLENCKLGELISAIEAFLPEWKEYKLVSKLPYEFSNPIIIKVKEEKPLVYYPVVVPPGTSIDPYDPWVPPYRITCGTEYLTMDTKGLLNKGVYNFQL